MRIIVRVRELRKHHNLTQEELARQLNISRQSLISLEQGRWLPSLPLVLQLSEFFRTPLEEVIYTGANGQAKEKPTKEVAMPRDLGPWSPFRDFRDEVDRLIDQSARMPMGSPVFPTINLKQDDRAIYLEAHVPGFTEDSIDIDVADEYVTITGQTTQEKKNEDKETGYISREYQQQSFSRTVPLPMPVVRDKATAKLSHGVLMIHLPKVVEEKPKTKRLKPSA